MTNRDDDNDDDDDGNGGGCVDVNLSAQIRVGRL